MSRIQSEWSAYHLFYHGDRNRVILDFVKPVVGRLLRESLIDSFFFVRYSLGGPHVRLRLRVLPGCAGRLEEQLSQAAATFLARWPSVHPLTEEAIRELNRSILAWDPEGRDEIYPDNTLRAFPFAMEIERYGGPELIGHSLDFFTLSSVQAIRFVDAVSQREADRHLPAAFLTLARQALGFARDGQELDALLGYAVERWRDALRPAVDQADRVFERRQDAFCVALSSEVEQLMMASGGAPTTSLAEAARRLSWELRLASGGSRQRIGKNQMHMTANRLGLTNPEETYLCRLLSRSAREVASSRPAFWGDLNRFLEDRSTPPTTGDAGLGSLLIPVLQELERTDHARN